MAPLISVGIPVYNGMPWLPECIESIRCQTYQHFELLVINDGSTDGTLDYLRSVQDPRLHIITQENRGIPATLNRLLSETKTPWLLRQDADDVAFPDRLRLIAEHITRFPRAGMFYSHAVHYQRGRSLGRLKTSVGTPEELRQLTRCGYLLAVCHSSVALNVNKTRELGGYRPYPYVEDLDLWWRMALANDIHVIPAVTTGYRINATSVCARHLRTLAVNTLYVQYLLLSHLWSLPLRPQAQIADQLASLMDWNHLAYREQMWLATVDLGAKRHFSAARHTAAAALAAPGAVLGRFLYPFRATKTVTVGEPPAKFMRASESLWPGCRLPVGLEPRTA